jgi:hypothetical protein
MSTTIALTEGTYGYRVVEGILNGDRKAIEVGLKWNGRKHVGRAIAQALSEVGVTSTKPKAKAAKPRTQRAKVTRAQVVAKATTTAPEQTDEFTKMFGKSAKQGIGRMAKALAEAEVGYYVRGPKAGKAKPGFRTTLRSEFKRLATLVTEDGVLALVGEPHFDAFDA